MTFLPRWVCVLWLVTGLGARIYTGSWEVLVSLCTGVGLCVIFLSIVGNDLLDRVMHWYIYRKVEK